MSTETTWQDLMGAASPAISVFRGIFKLGKFAVDVARKREEEEEQLENHHGDSYVFNGEVRDSNVGGQNNKYKNK